MSAGVAFNNTPGDVLVPIFMTEFNAGAPPYSGTSRQLILARALPGSIAALAGVPINLGSQNPNAVAGLGSIGAEMILYARRRNPLGEIWFLDVGAPAGAVAAAGSITFTGTATSSGQVVRYIGGQRYSAVVANGDTAAAVAANFAADVQQGYSLFNTAMLSVVTAAVDGSVAGKVNLVARHGGTESNALRIEAGLVGDEVEVPGITVAIGAMTGGAGDVVMSTVLAKLGTQPFDWICGPYNTVTQLNAVRDFLSDTGTGRSAPLVDLLGHYTSFYEGNLSSLTVFGQTRNDRHVTLLGTNQIPTPPWCVVAALCGEIAFRKNLGRSLREAVEIARPMQGLVLEGILPPKDPNAVFGYPDRDSLLRNGISTFTVTADRQIACDRIITTYQTNPAGLDDRTWLDIESIAISAYFARYFRQKVQGAYPRCAFMEDNPANLQGVVTPDDLIATSVHAATDCHRAGLIRQLDLFVANLICQPDYVNGRANFYLPITKASQLRVFAANQTMFLDQADQAI